MRGDKAMASCPNTGPTKGWGSVRWPIGRAQLSPMMGTMPFIYVETGGPLVPKSVPCSHKLWTPFAYRVVYTKAPMDVSP